MTPTVTERDLPLQGKKGTAVRKKTTIALIASLSSLALATGSVHAQAAADRADAGGEIVVTAQKRAQSTTDVGITMSVLSGSDLQDRGIKSAADLALTTPGLVVNDSGAQGVPIYTLRGVGFNNIYANASSTVGLYVDDVAIPYPVMSRGALFDIERVEVLKAPQGDLYGRNTTAGQINFITGRPTRQFHAGYSLEYGRFNSVDAEGFVSGPISDAIQVRVAGKQVLSSGWQRSLSRPLDKLLGSKDETAFRGKVNFDLGGKSSILLEGYWTRDQSEGVAAAALDGRLIGLPSAQTALPGRGTVIYTIGDNRAADWTPEYRPRHNNHSAGGSAHVDLDLGSVSLASISAYDHYVRHETNDWDGAAANISGSVNNTAIESFSQELRLAGDTADQNLNWIVGGYYSWDKLSEDYNYFMSDSFFNTALGIDELNTRYTQVTRSIAGFGHLEWDVAPKLQIVGGLRFTHETRSFQGCTYDRNGTYAATTNNVITPFLILPNGLPDPGLVPFGGCAVYDDRRESPNFGTFAPFNDRITADKWMGKAGLNYKPNSDLLLYASVSTGFKSGGFNGGNSNTTTQQAAYRPERLIAYEAGVKSDIRQLGLNLEAAAFYYDYRDKQEAGLAVTFVGNINGLTNIPRSRIYGAEISGTFRPTRELSLAFGATYLNSKVLRWNPISDRSLYPNVITFDAAGLRLPNAPEFSFNLTPGYKKPVGSGLFVELAGDFNYRSSTSGSGFVYRGLNPYFLVNARLTVGKEDGPWQVSLWAKNLFNRYYFNYANDIGGSGTYIRVPGMPLTYGMRLSTRL